jgi:hypothetical protein
MSSFYILFIFNTVLESSFGALTKQQSAHLLFSEVYNEFEFIKIWGVCCIEGVVDF